MHAALEKIRGKVGLWSFAHEALPPARSAEAPALAEELGFAAYWTPESIGREALTSASLLLQGTSEIVVGTDIAQIWARDPIAAASGARTLAGASGERFILGLGVSHAPIVTRRGHTYEKPLEAMATYLEAMKQQPTRSSEPVEAAPVLIAALGPKMLALASSAALGALPYLVGPAHTAEARSIMGPDAFLAVEQGVVLDASGSWWEVARSHLTTYLSLPNYRNSFRRQGFDEADLEDGGSDRLVDAIVAHGDEAAIWERVEAHFAAGADHVAIQILSSTGGAMPADDWRRLSPRAAGR
jgi:probable F420-dependent oxidoreductase